MPGPIGMVRPCVGVRRSRQQNWTFAYYFLTQSGFLPENLTNPLRNYCVPERVFLNRSVFKKKYFLHFQQKIGSFHHFRYHLVPSINTTIGDGFLTSRGIAGVQWGYPFLISPCRYALGLLKFVILPFNDIIYPRLSLFSSSSLPPLLNSFAASNY